MYIHKRHVSGLTQWPSWQGTASIHTIKLPPPAEWPCPKGLSKITPGPCLLYTLRWLSPSTRRSSLTWFSLCVAVAQESRAGGIKAGMALRYLYVTHALQSSEKTWSSTVRSTARWNREMHLLALILLSWLYWRHAAYCLTFSMHMKKRKRFWPVTKQVNSSNLHKKGNTAFYGLFLLPKLCEILL